MPAGKFIIFCLLSALGTIAARAQDVAHLKDLRPVTFHGNISTGLNYYSEFSKGGDSLSKSSFGRSPSYFLQANPVLSLYGFSIPLNVMISSQNKSFHSPFNRFGMSPYYKWAKLHLGWRSLNFSQFTLGGQQISGAGFELTPGKFRAAFMYGKLNNAVTDISLYNNLNNTIPLYKRKGFAAMIGYGSADNFIEFSYLQAEDDSNSLHGISLDTVQPKPAANQVAGIKGQVTLMQHLILETEGAVSYYTRDITARLQDLNAPLKGLAAVGPRTTSQISVAGVANLRYNFHTGNVSLGYRRVGPDYHSMGTFFMQNDLEQYTAGLRLAFWKQKIHFQGRFGWQRNDLAHTAVAKSTRTIGNANISFNPVQNFGIDFQYSNYGISQQIIPQLRDPATAIRYDSIRISQVNRSISIAPHVFINGRTIQHAISLQTSFQKLKNDNKAQSNQDFTSTVASLIYSLILPKKKISITNTFNYFNTVLTDNKTATTGYNLGISKSLLPDATKEKPFITSVTLSLFGGYFSNKFKGGTNGNTLAANPAVTIVFLKRHSLQLNANYTSTKNKNAPINPLRRQMMISTRYNLSF